MSKKRLLITGCAGFIGFHLATHLRKRGDEVIGLDNFSNYYDVSLKEKRRELLDCINVEVIEGDICTKGLIEHLLAQHKITHLVHLAAQPGVRYSLENPDIYIETNVQGFLQVLEAIRANPNIPLTYASSSSVYGLSESIPYTLSDQADRQASLYGMTKRSNELMANTYHHLFGCKVTGLRFFTVYGPWGRPDMAPTIFSRKIMNQEPIAVFNHGKMERDFTYIDDIVDGTIAAIDLEAENELFNLGNNQPVVLDQFIDILEKNLGQKAIRDYQPMQAGDVVKTFADIEHAKKLLGYRPLTSLEQGLEKFAHWITNRV